MFSFGRSSPLRAIPYTRLWLGLLLWGLVAGSLLAGTGWELYQNFLFACHSQPVSGTVERKFVQISHGRHGPSYTPYLVFRYQVDNLQVTTKSTVQGSTYSRVYPGGTIPLLCLTGNVASNRIELPAEIQHLRIFSFIMIAASILLTAGGIWIFLFLHRRNRTNLRLLLQGRSCQGKVTAKNFDVVGKAQTRCYYLLFTFRDDRGAELNGKTWYLTTEQESFWQEDNPIRVYFDPADSRRFTVDLNNSPGR
jgi:hypothetical protein